MRKTLCSFKITASEQLEPKRKKKQVKNYIYIMKNNDVKIEVWYGKMHAATNVLIEVWGN
jgi:hypothetical protein